MTNPSRLRVDAGLLFAVSAFVARFDPRPALRGILIEPAQRGAFLVASDGAAIAIAHDPDASCQDSIVLMIEPSGELPSEISGREATVRLEECDVVVDGRSMGRCIPIEADYPKWRRYLPNVSAALTRPSVGAELAGPAHYTGQLLERLSFASSVLKTNSSPVRFAISQPARRAPAVVTFDGARFAVVMQPLAVSHSDDDWVTQAVSVRAQAA